MAAVTQDDINTFISTFIDVTEGTRKGTFCWALSKMANVTSAREMQIMGDGHKTYQSAMFAGIGYIKKCRNDLYRAAQKEAIESARYIAMKNKAANA